MIFKNTKLLILSFLQSKYAIYILCLLSFSEAIFFPIPPDLLLIPLAIINYNGKEEIIFVELMCGC